MSFELEVATVFSGLSTVVLGVIGWMLRKVYGNFEEAVKLIQGHAIRIAVLEEKVKKLEG